MTAIFKKCPTCGDDFYTENNKKVYCRSNCKDRASQDRHREKINAGRWKKKEENKRKVLRYLNGEYRCSHCGYTSETTAPFDWHHVDPSTKEYEPANLLICTWDKLKKELDKCIFLCKNCHALEHERLKQW